MAQHLSDVVVNGGRGVGGSDLVVDVRHKQNCLQVLLDVLTKKERDTKVCAAFGECKFYTNVDIDVLTYVSNIVPR